MRGFPCRNTCTARRWHHEKCTLSAAPTADYGTVCRLVSLSAAACDMERQCRMDGSGDDCGAGALCMARHAVHPAAASAVCPASSLGQWRRVGADTAAVRAGQSLCPVSHTPGAGSSGYHCRRLLFRRRTAGLSSAGTPGASQRVCRAVPMGLLFRLSDLSDQGKAAFPAYGTALCRQCGALRPGA